MYAPEILYEGNLCSYQECMNKTAVIAYNFRDFAVALRARKVAGAFEETNVFDFGMLINALPKSFVSPPGC